MTDRTIWITGASSGIGEALAVRFAQEGARLVLSARRQSELERVAERCRDNGLSADQVLVLPMDVTNWEALPGAVQTVLNQFGQVDLLINNAGLSQRSLCVETEMSVYRQLMEVDVMGQIALTKAVLPHMLERGVGHIAVTASVAGKVGAPLRTGYCAAKHAVMGFFDSLRTEVEGQGVHISTIVPGFIRTDIARSALAGDGKASDLKDDDIENGMDVNDCAEVVVKGLNAKKREIPVGKGKEMAALWLKRLAPEVLFRMARAHK
ncbi:SDR family oxidoreductase [Marinobacter salexigens]|jgi:short-subunit dehydrogenase|uniref:SDR family oxidoreductase n=1 Tax=Marinobacter salexigens TaxID=1925763 RepID=A0ABS6A677_9GAMM|nr:SDR family oxidoreductase [Marinobacter salexigens]MBU2873496.1 SDR family oxidoreductase [Marinobacter salexigens]